MAEKIVIAQLDIDSKALLKSATETKTVISQLRAEQALLKKQGEENSEQFVKNEAELKTLSAEYRTQSNALSSLISSNGELLKSEEALTIAIDKEINSISDARKSNSELLKIRNELNLNSEEGIKAAELINQKLDENNAFIKQNVSAYEQQKIGIGDYATAIKQAVGDLGIFGKEGKAVQQVFNTFAPVFTTINNEVKNTFTSFTQFNSTVNQTTAATQTATTATTGLTVAQRASAIALNATSNALKLFRLALISTGIGAIVVALGSLVAFLTSTQEGVDAVTAVTRPLKAIFQSLLGVFQNVGKALFDAFTNPKQALTDLFEFVKNNLINRFTALGEILQGIITLDFKRLADGVAQAATGVEGLSDKVANAAQNTAKFLEDAAKRGAEIDRLTKEIEKSEIDINKQRAIAEGREKELQLISRDTSRTAAEREKAAREIIKIKQEEAEREAKILELRIERLIIEQSLNDTNRANNKELADLEAQLIKTRQAGQDAELEQIRVISAARKEERQAAIEAQKSRIEANLREAKAQIDLFEAQQGFRAKTLEDQFILEQQLTGKRIELLQKEFEAGRKTKTEFETERLRISEEFLRKQAELTVDFARREVEEQIKASQTVIDRQQFITDQILIEENNRITTLAELRKEFARTQLEQGLINEQDFQAKILEIDAETAAKRLEAENLRKQQDAEAAKIELENRRAVEDLLFQNDLEIQQERLEQQRQIEIAAAQKVGADVTAINEKFNLLQVQLKRKAEIAKVDATRSALQETGQLLAAFGVKNKNLTIAIATADAFLAATKAYLSQLNLTPDAPVRAAIAGAKALGFGLANVARIASTDTKFEKGGVMEIGGKRHSQGGTKFVGSDGTRFEAERGELIGVLNRKASDAFMSFNNAFGQRGNVGTSYAQAGGIIARGLDSGQNDLEQIALLTAQALANVPPPIVTVEDINTGFNRVATVVDGATF